MKRPHFMRPQALQRSGRSDWYSIKAQADGPTRVSIYDEIGYWGVTAGDFITALADVSGPLDVHLNSPGGEVFDGLAIYEALRQRTDPVTISVDSLAASIASVIAMAADPGKLLIARTASIMIHNGWGMTIGDANEMRKAAAILDTETENIAAIYADRTGKPAAHWASLMAEESWFKGQQAVDAGLADGILAYPDKNAPAADSWDLSIFSKVPDLSNANVDTSAWDAARAWHNGAESDNPESFYRGICAGHHNSGDPSTQAHWALPHHYHPSDPPNEAGVRNSLSRLPQTQDLADEAAVRAHLEAHMKAINPDYVPEGAGSVDVFSEADAQMFINALKGV